MLERLFRLSEHRTTVATEVFAGVTTFLTIMPLTVSITDGIAFGFISYAVLKLATGRAHHAHWLVLWFAALFVARYVWLLS